MTNLLQNTWWWWRRRVFLNLLMKRWPVKFVHLKVSPPSAVSSFTHSYDLFFFLFFNTMAVNQAGKGWLSDSVSRYDTPLIRLSQRLSSNSKAFDDEDEDDEFVWHLAASMLLFNTKLLVHMVGINPWDMAYGPRWLFAPRITSCCTLMNYGIRRKYANLGISLVIPLSCKLQWLIYYVWTEDWSEEVLAASFVALSQLLSFTSWKDMNNRGGSSKTRAFSCSISPKTLENCSLLPRSIAKLLKITMASTGFGCLEDTQGNEHEVVANPLISPHKADVKC